MVGSSKNSRIINMESDDRQFPVLAADIDAGVSIEMGII